MIMKFLYTVSKNVILLKINWLVLLLAVAVGSSILFATPAADAAGVIEGEFKLGEVLDESVGWFIVVGLRNGFRWNYFSRD